MGTTFCSEWRTKAQLVAYLNTSLSPGYTLIKHSVVGNHLWQLFSRPDGTRLIGLCLMSSGGRHGWGYKGVNETAHPHYYDCPMSLLNAAHPAQNDSSAEWRKRVIAHHEWKRKLKDSPAKAGLVVPYGPHSYRLTRDLARRGWMASRLPDGAIFRMTSRQVKEGLENLLRRGEEVAA